MIKEGCTCLLIFWISELIHFKRVNFTNQASVHLTFFAKLSIELFCRNVSITSNIAKTGIIGKETNARSYNISVILSLMKINNRSGSKIDL